MRPDSQGRRNGPQGPTSGFAEPATARGGTGVTLMQDGAGFLGAPFPSQFAPKNGLGPGNPAI